MPEISKTHLGGTMRLGLRSTIFGEGTESWSKVRKLYGGAKTIWERHRHRYEVGPAYVERLEKSGMDFVGRDEKGERMQVFELRGTRVSSKRLDSSWHSVSKYGCRSRSSILRWTTGASRILH